MANYKTEARGYWKVTGDDLKSAEACDGIEFSINGTGKRWSDGAGRIIISKGSNEWNYLYKHIKSLNCFKTKNEHTNSESVPSKLRSCFKKK